MTEGEDSLRRRRTQRQVYFRLLKAFRIMPVKMLNIPAIMNRAVSTVLPMARSPFVAAIAQVKDKNRQRR